MFCECVLADRLPALPGRLHHLDGVGWECNRRCGEYYACRVGLGTGKGAVHVRISNLKLNVHGDIKDVILSCC